VVILSAIFLVEFTVRCLDSQQRLSYVRRHWIDLVTCIPVIGPLRVLRLLRLLRFIRLGIALRQTFQQSEWLLVPSLLLLWSGAAYCLWIFERGINPAIGSIPDAMYQSLLITLTLGQGSSKTVTAEGQLVAGLLVFLAVGLVTAASSRLTSFWLGDDRDKEIQSGIRSLTAEVRAANQTIQRMEHTMSMLHSLTNHEQRTVAAREIAGKPSEPATRRAFP
jgi:voltage-gated potassium channel